MCCSSQAKRRACWAMGRDRYAALSEVAGRGRGDLQDLGGKAAVLEQERVEHGEVARAPRLGEGGELAERFGRHAPPRERAAWRIRSEKRIAAATAR